MVVGFIEKMPDWIKSLINNEFKEHLTNTLHLCRERSTDEATIATSHPWAAGSLILATLAKLYSASLPLIHYHRAISIILHLYHACVSSKACAPYPILETVTGLLKDMIFIDGLPPKTSVAISLKLYTTKKTGTSKSFSKAKGGTKVKEPALYSTHTSIAMQFSNPKPGDLHNDLLDRVRSVNAEKDVSPTEDWTPLTMITQIRAAAKHEFRREKPRAAINIFAIFCLCMEIVDDASQTWGIEWGLGDAWVRATLAKIEELLQGMDGKKQDLVGVSSCMGALGKTFGKYHERLESDVFWKLG